jgi:hypothetical protein
MFTQVCRVSSAVRNIRLKPRKTPNVFNILANNGTKILISRNNVVAPVLDCILLLCLVQSRLYIPSTDKYKGLRNSVKNNPEDVNFGVAETLESLQQPSKFSPEIRNNVLFYF